MSDLISREQAIKSICEDGTWLERQGCVDITMAERKQRDVDILQALPSAEPVQKKGKWIIFPPCIEEICMCSNCKTKFKEAYQHRNICPNCGARMVGEEE